MKTQLIIKTDQEVKQTAQHMAERLGLPLSTVINAYLKEFIRSREVTFSLEPTVRPAVGKMLRKASADYKKGKNVSPVFSDTDKMLAYLHSK